MKNKRFLRHLSLAALAVSAISSPAFAYTETLSVGTTILGTTNVIHNGSINSETVPAGTFTAESGPIPRLTYSANGVGDGNTYTALMSYDYSINAAANADVVVGFTGLIQLNSTGSQQYNPVIATFHVGSQSSANYAHGIFSASATRIGGGIDEILPGAPSSVPWTLNGSASVSGGPFSFEFSRSPTNGSSIEITESGVDAYGNPIGQSNWLNGRFSGELIVHTDNTGAATARIWLSLQGSGAGNGGSVYGMIDPYIFIAPSYLANNPTATLAVEAGVGNAAPVPEPNTYAMLLAGLGIIGTLARRRQQGSAQ